MAKRTGIKVSSLTRKLLSDSSDLEARIRINEQGPEALCSGPELIRACKSWDSVKQLLLKAVAEKRPTLVYGDYDVDGVVSTFLMFRWLRTHDVPGNCFIPSRMHHGYGLDRKVLQQAVEQGYKTLIALDCGTANIEEIKLVREAGIDVVIIDHHEAKEEKPEAALLNHHLEDHLEQYCTAGLVYHVLQTLRQDSCEPPPPDEIELVGLATIADVVPLTPGNWALAHLGLQALPETLNPGMAELIKVSKLHGLTRLTARQASFSLIPRLNAAGRMRSANLMLRLLQAGDSASARKAALDLDNLNTERKRISDETARSALLQATDFEDKSGLAVYNKNWHPGILGIVAARVAETTNKPVVVLGDAPQAKGVLTGSVRTRANLDVVKALEACSATLISYGGHSAAAGLKLEAKRLEAFREEWSAAITNILAESSPDESALNCLPEVGLGELSKDFEDEIWNLEPFGNGFPAPRCVLRGCRVERMNYMGREKTHLSLHVTDGENLVRLVGFNQSHLYHQLTKDQPLQPVVVIEPDNWNNRYSIVLRLLGLREEYDSQGSGQ